MLATAIVAFVGLSMLLVGLVSAVGDIAVTVTPSGVAISVDDGAVGFGPVPLGTLETTLVGGVDDTQGITNNGGSNLTTLTIEFDTLDEAACTTSGAGNSWNAVPFSPSQDQFTLDMSDDALSTQTNIVANNATTAVPGGAGLTPTSTVDIDFEIEMPPSITTGTAECTISMTLTAS